MPILRGFFSSLRVGVCASELLQPSLTDPPLSRDDGVVVVTQERATRRGVFTSAEDWSLLV